MKRHKRYIKRAKRLKKNYYLLGAVLLILLLALLELTNTTHIFHKSPVPAVIPVANTSSDTSANNNTPSKNSQNRSTKDTSSTGGSDDKNSSKSSLPLYAPYGDFVSNHHPSLSGKSAPSLETSVCNTTPGASCYITFTKGSISTKLPSKITNSDGSTFWQWDVKAAGLTPGNWTITAVASLNGQTKSTPDPLLLTVSR